jgi:hypothetical protein
MSRRYLLVLLAASAALTASPAAADPECFGGSCRLPQVVEPPVVVPPVVVPPAPQALPVTRAPSEATQTFAQSPRRPLPKLAPSSEPPLAAEPPYRRSEWAIARDFEPSTMRVAEPIAAPTSSNEPRRRPARHRVRVVQGQIDPGPVVGYPFAAAPVLLGVPPVIYGGYAVRPVYLVAPSAKIIHVDRDDD